jgi:hypothetical protein
LAPRRNALDAACQSVKGFFVVKRTVELYPRGALKKTQQIALFGPFARDRTKRTTEYVKAFL